MNWIRDCLSSNSSVDQKTRTLRDKISTLVARESDVRTEVEHAEIQLGYKRRNEVDNWLKNVQVKKDEVQSILKDGQDQGSSSNSNLTDRLDRLIAEVDELMQQGDKFRDRLVLSDQESTRLPLWLGKKPAGTNFQQNYERILEWLQHQENHIIGVYGMGGVGKTTLLMKIHDEVLKNSNLYGRVYWVTVSQNWSVHKLQGDIAKVLGLGSLEEDDKRKRAAILHNKLVANGPTVLILDDMWKQFSENDVGISREGSSCKTILSTRSLEVCRRMGCKDFVIKAKILQKFEAWYLFVENLGHYNTLTVEAKEIARDIAKECGGLPLAITTMACTMSEIVDIHEWKNALKD
ncbi:disease resistance protein SUMM2-like [Beta vulgaris subsp. vulgaris]|uniref:disease resistance protein SUMM2-like n=1 Tax=Beta vulgaris subsp. vulgaris TaxID=3555 RepID=UPI0025488220|nr:disease resistance protein SUMM2-like [Beta vulgaris subsp. vulgaris]